MSSFDIKNEKQIDDKPIKVTLLESDFAVLSLLGFPLGLTIQLQQSNLNLTDALWTAKSSKSTHPCMPTEKQPEPFQQDNDEEVANDEEEWTVVKKKKPRDICHVSKTLLKLRAPCHVGEYVQQ